MGVILWNFSQRNKRLKQTSSKRIKLQLDVDVSPPQKCQNKQFQRINLILNITHTSNIADQTCEILKPKDIPVYKSYLIGYCNFSRVCRLFIVLIIYMKIKPKYLELYDENLLFYLTNNYQVISLCLPIHH